MYNLINKFKISEILNPVSKELAKANSELKNIMNKDDLNLGSSMNNPDRSIRQAMILLPFKAIGNGKISNDLPKLCAAIEIIYSAFDMHDEISDIEWTSNKTDKLEKSPDNSLAVLSGDTMITTALQVISEIIPRSLLLDVMKMIEENSYAEISNEIQKGGLDSKESYIELVKSRAEKFSKTFTLMGAYISKASLNESAVLEKLSYNLGMAYRIINDSENRKTPLNKIESQTFVFQFADEAKNTISGFKEGIYKRSMHKLINFFISQS